MNQLTDLRKAANFGENNFQLRSNFGRQLVADIYWKGDFEYSKWKDCMVGGMEKWS